MSAVSRRKREDTNLMADVSKSFTTQSYTMSMEDSISLEETNKIRISLGLKPLTEDKAPANDKEQEAEENYKNQREREKKEQETKYVELSLLSKC